MSHISVAVCVPGNEQVSFFWAYDFARLMAWTAANRSDVRLLQYFTSSSNLSASREKLVQAALRAQADYVLFVDADMRFPKTALGTLLEHQLPAVGANYTARQEPFLPQARLAINDDPQQRVFTLPESAGVQKVAANGLGLVLVQADYLRRMTEPRFMIGWAHGAEGEHGAHITEDMYFCRKLHEVGCDLYVDHDLSKLVAHTGAFEFTPEHAAQYAQAELAKAAEQLKKESNADDRHEDRQA